MKKVVALCIISTKGSIKGIAKLNLSEAFFFGIYVLNGSAYIVPSLLIFSLIKLFLYEPSIYGIATEIATGLPQIHPERESVVL